jgi:hypothetical protein
MGAVPAFLDVPYVHAPFRAVPGIVGENWTVVAREMRRLIGQEREDREAGRPSELDRLQRDGSTFYEELQDCMKHDMGQLMGWVVNYYGRAL